MARDIYRADYYRYVSGIFPFKKVKKNPSPKIEFIKYKNWQAFEVSLPTRNI